MKNLTQITLIFGLLAAFQIPLKGQVSYELNEKAQAKMAQFASLEGKWKGSGWMMGQDRVRSTFESEEIVQLKLSGTVLEIEGIGVSDGKVVHHALGLINPTEEEGKFEFTSILQSGSKGTYPARMEDGKLVWQPVDQVRYIIQINEHGQWFEIGEYNAGLAWYKFFEMTMDKVN